MGNFFTSTQIYNDKKLSSKQFIDEFCKKMAEEGYVACGSDDSELSYILKFADNCKWVTITSEAYEQGNALSHKDTGRIAKMLGTTCVNTVVIDSDCAILELYDKNGQKADTLTIGRADDYLGNDIPKPSEEVWKPFLSNGSKWNRFIEICSKDEVFVEDSLSELAPVIGMDSDNILFSTDYVDESDKRTVFLDFKKARSSITLSQGSKAVEKSEKKLTINAVFKQVFGEILESLGYKKLNIRYPMYAKLINNEIVKVIGMEDIKSDSHFSINAGVTTVYRREIELHKGFKLNMNWLMGLDAFDKYLNNSPVYNRSLGWFNYDKNNQTSIIESMKNAFEETKKIVFPVFEQIHDLNDVIDYFCTFNTSFIEFGTPEEWLSDNYVTEGLLCIKIGDSYTIAKKRTESGKKLFEHYLEIGVEGFSKERCEVIFNNLDKSFIKWKRAIDDVINNPQEFEIAMSELKRRKEVNLNILKSYNID